MIDLKDKKNRVRIFILGIIILTFGISLIVKSEFGASAWDAVNIGASSKASISPGMVAFLIAIIMTIIAKVIRHGNFRFNTLITALLLSISIDFWLFIMSNINMDLKLTVKISLFVCGNILIALGIALYLLPKFPVNSIDDCTVAIKEKFGITIGMAKFCVDFIGLVIAFLIQGPIGIGTVIVTVSLGPLIDIFTKKIYVFIK